MVTFNNLTEKQKVNNYLCYVSRMIAEFRKINPMSFEAWRSYVLPYKEWCEKSSEIGEPL